MSKDNQKETIDSIMDEFLDEIISLETVSNSLDSVTKISKKGKELERRIQDLKETYNKSKERAKKHTFEYMKIGLDLLVLEITTRGLDFIKAEEFVKKYKNEKKKKTVNISKDLDPIKFKKILKNYKKGLIDSMNDDHHYYPPRCLFNGYYKILNTFYCCSSNDIASYLDIKPNLVDQLKKSLWEHCNNSEKNYLKIHDKDSFGYFDKKVSQLELQIFKNYLYKYYYSPGALKKVKFENLEINLKEELIEYYPIALENQIHWWRKFDLKYLQESYEISLEETIKYKIHFLANGADNGQPDESYQSIDERGFPETNFDKIYKDIRKQIIKEFKPEKDYLDKLNKIAAEKCSSSSEFLEKESSILRKKYNLNKNDFNEIKNNFIRKSIKNKDAEQSGLYRKLEIIDEEKKLLRSQAVGNVYAEKTKLEAEKTELQKEIELRKSLEKRMKKLVAQYSHTLGNTLFPETIYNVAEVLKNHTDFRNDSLILKKAYHAEVLVKHQAEMLRIKHGSDTGEEFQRLILKDRLQVDSKEDAVNIMEILGYAAERVVGRLLNQDYVKIKDVRAKLVKKSGMDIDELRNDFENKVFFDQKQTSLNWINENLAKLQIGKMSSTWGNILIRKDSYTHALLQGHWGEILFNAFKYANHTKTDFLTIKFDEQVEKDYTWLQMVWENPCKKIDKNHGGEGLDGITEDLMQLNKTEDEKFSLYSNNKKNNFQVNLFYRSDMLTSPVEDLDLVENYFD